MSDHVAGLTTGLTGLDQALKGILPGDNIVWQVDAVEDYMTVVAPYVEAGLRSGRKVIYFRFASQPPAIFQGRSRRTSWTRPRASRRSSPESIR